MRRHNDHLTIAAATILGIFSCPTFVLAELQRPSEPSSAQTRPGSIQTCPGRMPLTKEDEPRGPLRVGRHAGVTAPWRKSYVRPDYPERARARGVKGVVVLEALLDRKGIVRSTQILGSIPLLDQAAADAVCQWQYTPAVIDEVPTATALTIAVNFPPR